MSESASFTKDVREVKHQLDLKMSKQEEIPSMTEMQPHKENKGTQILIISTKLHYVGKSRILKNSRLN